jgi:hypothetical protein
LLILNTNKSIDQIRAQFGYQVRPPSMPADRPRGLGLLIVNTTMLGALVRGTGGRVDAWSPLKARFEGEERNLALRRAYEQTILSN